MTKRSKNFTIASVLLLAVLIFSACTPTASPTVSVETPADETEAPAAPITDPTSAPEPPMELTVVFLSWVPAPVDLLPVQEALNQILLEKINATVKLVPINGGEYQQKVNLMLQSGEEMDLFVTGTGLGYNVQAATGLLIPLDNLIENYGQGLKEAVDQKYLNAAKSSDGQVYGVPTLRSFAGQTGFVMRKDLVDKYGIDISSVTATKDIEPILKTIYDNEPEIAPIVPEAPGAGVYGMAVDVPYDALGDSIGVLPNYGQELIVDDLFETEEYADWVYLLHDWYQKGYILKDAATNRETAADLLKANRGFGYFSGVTIGSAEQATMQNGMPMIVATVSDPFLNSGYITQIMWAIPRQSKSSEKAMAFLNLLFSDPEVVNLLNYGIEDRHYVKVSDNVIKFPEGVTTANHPYFFGLAWEFGNQFLSYVMEGTDPDIWEKTREYNASALPSKALGFVMDVEPIKNEFAAVLNVFMQYQSGLGTGSVDPDVYLPEFIEKLKAAGIDKIVTEKQQQLDAWAANNH